MSLCDKFCFIHSSLGIFYRIKLLSLFKLICLSAKCHGYIQRLCGHWRSNQR